MSDFLEYAASVLGWLCHQRPDRSPHLWGMQFWLCWRCCGIFFGVIAFAALLLMRRVPSLRLSLALASLMPLDVLFAALGFWSGANEVRFVTGVLWGACGTSLGLHFAASRVSSQRRVARTREIVCGSGGQC